MTEQAPVNETTPETEIETPEAEAAQTEAHGAIYARLREAGEAGKKEWEGVLSKVGEILQLPVEERREELKTSVQGAFVRAQTKGADLLLKLISQVRKGVVGLEDSLREARDEETVSPA